MAGGICYGIDTSALINWWVEDYSPDVFPGLLPKMEALIAAGRLRAVRNVKDELGDGDLRKWCLAREEFFVEEDEEIQQRVAQLMAAYQDPKKPQGINKADPFVIALADLNSWHVVSAEKGGSLAKNPKIPIVCDAIGVEHIRFLDMLRLEKWKF